MNRFMLIPAALFLFGAGAVLAQPAPEKAPPVAGGKFFDATDTNKDGVLTKDEWLAAGRRPEGFAMMDLNKDGKVTRAEGRAAMQKVMEMRSMPAGN